MRAYPIILRGQEILAWLDGPLKGTVPRDFRLQIFFLNQFPPSPWVYCTIRVVSDFFENSRRYSQLKVHQWCPWHCTGGKWKKIFNLQNLPPVSLIPVVHLDLRISPRISKKIEMTLMLFLGAWGKMIHEKNSWHVSLKGCHCWFKLCKCDLRCSWMPYSLLYNLQSWQRFQKFPRGFSLPRG